MLKLSAIYATMSTGVFWTILLVPNLDRKAVSRSKAVDQPARAGVLIRHSSQSLAPKESCRSTSQVQQRAAYQTVHRDRLSEAAFPLTCRLGVLTTSSGPVAQSWAQSAFESTSQVQVASSPRASPPLACLLPRRLRILLEVCLDQHLAPRIFLLPLSIHEPLRR